MSGKADLEKYIALLKEHTPDYVVGFDETGNGAIAGPLCVGACALKVDFEGKIRDSKRYSTDKARHRAYKLVASSAENFQAFMAMPNVIADKGHREALEGLYEAALQYMYAEYGDNAVYIVDGNVTFDNTNVPHTALVKADDFIPAVSAASIIAKFERDQIMKDVEFFPWRFDKSKGYPTPEHLERLNTLGPIKGFHRMNVERVQKAFEECGWYQKADDETIRED